MALSADYKLGPYEILEPIGKGGMGEVYRARDARVGRDVAVKVSAEQFTGRFEREARAIAALNHPNVCTLYDVGPNYLVMELIEGPTLADRIREGAIPLEEALGIAMQIAEALEAAHDKGIVHRDLKPANVKIRPDGSVKVLDFGLAKPAEATELSSDSPTMMSMTAMGMIMGTAGYMAPEQARGKPVDKRADIWSFGVVLYEMLTGDRLFKGEDVVETVAAVMHKDPDLSVVPPKVQRLLKRCLEKDPRKRLRDITGMEFLLEEPPPPISPDTTSPRFGWLWPSVAAVFALAAAALSFVHFRETPPELRVVSATLLPPENAEFDFDSSYALQAISPDGTRLVFGAKVKGGKQQLWLRRLDSPTAQPLPGTEDAGAPFWSPDSRWVGFGQGTKLKKIDIQGGPPVAITDLSGPFRGGSWSPLGVIVFGISSNGGPILRVAAAGGTPAPAASFDRDTDDVGHRYPWFLPDGRHFLYTLSTAAELTPVRVASIDEPGKPGKVVAQANSTAAYAQGHLLYLRENTLMAQPFDVNRLETTGEAVPVAEGVAMFNPGVRVAGFTVSPAGFLVYATGGSAGRSRLVWKDRQGKALGNLGDPTGLIGAVDLSPDGRRVAATVVSLRPGDDVWIYDAARGIPTRFTFGSKPIRESAWSPDGNTLYLSARRKGPSLDLFRKASNGAGTEEPVLEDSANKNADSVSPDGKLLLYTRIGEKTGQDLWVLPLAAGAKPEPRVFLQTPFNEARGKFSPDGQWVAYRSNESGQSQVYAAPFPGPGGKRQISSAGGDYPRWRRDGKEIFYVTPDRQLMAAEVSARNGTLEVGKVQKLLDGILQGGGYTYDVSADGQKFLVMEQSLPAASPLTLVQNWTAGLRK